MILLSPKGPVVNKTGNGTFPHFVYHPNGYITKYPLVQLLFGRQVILVGYYVSMHTRNGALPSSFISMLNVKAWRLTDTLKKTTINGMN
ncbi:hypothetical protein BEWA_027670 [Theileria equi strain WA]|uniref:Uncharacterized protein n=1 Tax=Theileria equi strain WA TaxID=1537102 RepID=L0AXG2_THEEQ|nr:hypothetical protein BEWA_027670 [Theileria equi strain WA]AFZ79918.1 hypothetical protein BEWA_027670 [Theileria equi strain WA]|eukprot:XP_004829584.1 hypothetical protein BEWA_027670 [Theileria equi strain WA]